MFSLIIRVYEITRSNTAVSLVVITTVLPNILIGALAGVLVDNWERKVVMFFSHFLRVLAVLTFIISSESIIWIYVMTVIIGIITQFFFPAEGATIPEVVKNKNLLLTANSLFTLTFFSSVVIGNVLAGPFLQAFGPHLTFAFVALAFLAASMFTARLPGVSIMKVLKTGWQNGGLTKIWNFSRNIEGGLLHNFLFGLDHIKRTPAIRTAIYVLAVGQGMIAILGSIAPGFADHILNLPVADVSVLVMAPAAVGMIGGALLAGQFFAKTRREKLIRTGSSSAALILLLFSVIDYVAKLLHVPVVPFASLTLVALGMANAFLEVPINTLIQENTPEEVRSRVYGVISTVTGTAAVLPVLAAGAVADLFGVRFVMLLSGLVLSGLAMYNIRINGRNHATNTS